MIGFVFVVGLGIAGAYVLGWDLVTGGIIGACLWMMLFVWRNLGGGNPIAQEIARLREQNEYAAEDIANFERDRPPGYKAEVNYLREEAYKRQERIEELKRS
jgi:hypothetical protein